MTMKVRKFMKVIIKRTPNSQMGKTLRKMIPPLPPNVLLPPHAEDILFRANADRPNSFRVVSHESPVLSNNLSSQMEVAERPHVPVVEQPPEPATQPVLQPVQTPARVYNASNTNELYIAKNGTR